jgi:hypothetical protein
MEEQRDEQRELTVLFYFASDNPLAPLVVSEIKAIKDAGFQENTTVLVYFDPMQKGARSQLLDVNRDRRKIEKTHIGDGADPFVRNMAEDEVDPEELTPEMSATLDPKATVTAVESLQSFIQFALKKRTAKNYMLILIGHGMIVGNDSFLPDDDPISAITLAQLKDLCGMFTEGNETHLRLLGLHSCSMSSIEVAYQLKGKADYMLATQGTMFVNGWPYRQLLKKTLNQIKRSKQHARKLASKEKKDEQAAMAAAKVDYDELIGKLYFLSLYNFTDFITAGYSCDLALCRLQTETLEQLKSPLQKLVAELKPELEPRVSLIKDLILLAHWDAQSFWSENYTDLWDFCDCLKKRCNDAQTGLEILESSGASAQPITVSKEKLATISKLCQAVQDVLAAEHQRENPEGVVRYADNFGTDYQYARGLSIFFPWCEPLDDQSPTSDSKQDGTQRSQRGATSKKVMDLYRDYDFTRDFGDDSWFSFLNAYFELTKRAPLTDPESTSYVEITDDLGVNEDAARRVFETAKSAFTAGLLKRTPELKKTPDVGGDCTCPTIKNYPTVMPGKSGRNIRRFAITPRALGAFFTDRPNETVPPKDHDDEQ